MLPQARRVNEALQCPAGPEGKKAPRPWSPWRWAQGRPRAAPKASPSRWWWQRGLRFPGVSGGPMPGGQSPCSAPLLRLPGPSLGPALHPTACHPPPLTLPFLLPHSPIPSARAPPPHRPTTLSGRSRPSRSPTWAWSALNKMKKVGETGQDVWTLSKSLPATCGTRCHPRGLRAVQGQQREGRSGGKRPSSPAFEGAVCSERASDFSHFDPSRT